jgi:nucleoside-diphosphate-sugar epimerase
MIPSSIPTRVAMTGAAGFLGRAMASHLALHFPLRTLDVLPVEGPWEKLLGSAANPDDAMALCEGCSHLVIAHMAPNRPEIYENPVVPFDVNVKGVANLFHAASVHGIKRVVLISSTAVVAGQVERKEFLGRDLPPDPNGMYALTKVLQETIAKYYHTHKGMEIAALRPSYICDEDQLTDKYGRKIEESHWVLIDPRDIAEAARLALLKPDLGWEPLYVLGPPEAARHADVKYTQEFLGWEPKHTFDKFPKTVPG